MTVMSSILRVAIASLALLAPAASAQPSFDEVVPDDCWFYFVVDDVTGYQEELGESPLGQLLSDPAFDGLWEEWDNVLAELSDQAQDAAGVDPVAMMKHVTGSAAMAVLDVASKEEGEPPAMALTMLADVGENLEEFSDSFDALIDRFVEERELVFKVEEVGDIDAGVVIDPEEGMELTYGFVDSVFVFVVGDEVALADDPFGDMVASLAGDALPTLAEDATFQSSVASDADNGIRIWLNLARILEEMPTLLGEAESGQFEGAVESLGLQDLRAVAARYGLGESGSEIEIRYQGSGALTTVLTSAVGGQEPVTFDWMPPGVLSAWSLDLDLANLFDAFMGLAMKTDPDAGKDMLANLAAAEAEIGFNPRDDLLENLDGQIGYFVTEVDPSESLPFGLAEEGINGAVLLGVLDGDAMRTLLDDVVRNQGLHAMRKREEFEGFEIYSIPLGPFGIVLSYAALDDLLVISLAPSLVKDVLRRKGNAELASLSSSEDYQEVIGRLPAATTGLFYQPVEDGPKGVLEALAMLQLGDLGVPGASLEGTEIHALLQGFDLPDPDVVDKYYEGASVGTLTIHDEGIHSQWTGP